MKRLIVGNWKQNKNLAEIEKFFEEFSEAYQPSENVDVVICASYPYLFHIKRLIEKNFLKNVFAGAQDVSEFESGQHTGQVSAKQIKDFCDFSIIGHSETHSTSESVANKLENSLKVDITPILCIKDSNEFRSNLNTHIIQVYEDPSNISKNGDFQVLSVSSISEKISEIRGIIGDGRHLLYGGSVNLENIEALMQIQGITGFLPGSSSLDATTFAQLIKKVS